MQTIYKYELNLPEDDEAWRMTEILLPLGWGVVSVAMQGGRPCLWLLVNPEAPKYVEKFLLIGTNKDVDQATNREQYISIGSVVEDRVALATVEPGWGEKPRSFVWHVFRPVSQSERQMVARAQAQMVQQLKPQRPC